MNAAKSPQDALSFEEAYKQLQAIVTSLDSGQGDLEESWLVLNEECSFSRFAGQTDELLGGSNCSKGMNEGGSQ